jgi:mannosyltransferase OCH1-like enzyme
MEGGKNAENSFDVMKNLKYKKITNEAREKLIEMVFVPFNLRFSSKKYL